MYTYIFKFQVHSAFMKKISFVLELGYFCQKNQVILANDWKQLQFCSQRDNIHLKHEDLHVWKKRFNFVNFHLRFGENLVSFQNRNVARGLLLFNANASIYLNSFQ